MQIVSRHKIYFVLCVVTSLIGCGYIHDHHNLSTSPSLSATNGVHYKVAFSPDSSTTKLIIDTIASANKSINVAAYYLTSRTIADSLINAHVRGVNVQIVLDRRQFKMDGSQYNYLIRRNVPTRINKKYSHMHHKFMIIDDSIVETGSFNYTENAAKHNAENILIIYNNRELARQYLDAWQKLWNESK